MLYPTIGKSAGYKMTVTDCMAVATWFTDDIEKKRDDFTNDEDRNYHYLKLQILKDTLWHRSGAKPTEKGWKATDPQWSSMAIKSFDMVFADLQKFGEYYNPNKNWKDGGDPYLYWVARANYLGVSSERCFEDYLPTSFKK